MACSGVDFEKIRNISHAIISIGMGAGLEDVFQTGDE
jgi:hypothetical protein